MISLNKTCRYCPGCDLLIAHKDEIEAQLIHHFHATISAGIGEDYLVIGNLDRSDWQKGRTGIEQFRRRFTSLNDVKNVVQFKPLHGWGLKNNRPRDNDPLHAAITAKLVSDVEASGDKPGQYEDWMRVGPAR